MNFLFGRVVVYTHREIGDRVVGRHVAVVQVDINDAINLIFGIKFNFYFYIYEFVSNKGRKPNQNQNNKNKNKN